jgi:hypothetical protein
MASDRDPRRRESGNSAYSALTGKDQYGSPEIIDMGFSPRDSNSYFGGGSRSLSEDQIPMITSPGGPRVVHHRDSTQTLHQVQGAYASRYPNQASEFSRREVQALSDIFATVDYWDK